MKEPAVSLLGALHAQEVRSMYVFPFDMGSPVSATSDSNLTAPCSTGCDLRHTHRTKVLRLAGRIDDSSQRTETSRAVKQVFRHART